MCATYPKVKSKADLLAVNNLFKKSKQLRLQCLYYCKVQPYKAMQQ
jgi:hypothetical protein